MVAFETPISGPSLCEWVTSTNSLYLFVALGTSLYQYRLEKLEPMHIEFACTAITPTKPLTFMKCINRNVVAVADVEGGVGLVTFFRDTVMELFSTGVKGRLNIV